VHNWASRVNDNAFAAQIAQIGTAGSGNAFGDSSRAICLGNQINLIAD
jgi:hypothetical protein